MLTFACSNSNSPKIIASRDEQHSASEKMTSENDQSG